MVRQFLRELKEMQACSGLCAIREEEEFYGCPNRSYLSRRKDDESKAKAITGKEATVTVISQERGRFGFVVCTI